MPVLVDGAVWRSATDLFKALALGAKAVMVRTYAALGWQWVEFEE